mmetsp:Transcript_90875/g.272901  ORF Transcript_90875/g.272901 Transcript_90875/m.272901 type:complete len:239 (+) Transcript_90875:2117-2833(+)
MSFCSSSGARPSCASASEESAAPRRETSCFTSWARRVRGLGLAPRAASSSRRTTVGSSAGGSESQKCIRCMSTCSRAVIVPCDAAVKKVLALNLRETIAVIASSIGCVPLCRSLFFFLLPYEKVPVPIACIDERRAREPRTGGPPTSSGCASGSKVASNNDHRRWCEGPPSDWPPVPARGRPLHRCSGTAGCLAYSAAVSKAWRRAAEMDRSSSSSSSLAGGGTCASDSSARSRPLST